MDYPVAIPLNNRQRVSKPALEAVLTTLASEAAADRAQIALKADMAFAPTASYPAGTLPAAVRDLIADGGSETIDGGNF